MELASWVAKIICVRVLGRGNIQQRDGAGPPGGAGHPPRGHITRDGPGTITPLPFTCKPLTRQLASGQTMTTELPPLCEFE